jgi:FRG domain
MSDSPEGNLDVLLHALNEIITNPTEASIRTVLASHPALLSQMGLVLADSLTLIQTTPEGCAAGEELVLLLRSCAEQGVDAGLATYQIEVSQLRAQRRVDAERDAARRDALQPVDPEKVPPWARTITSEPVTSLHDCLLALREAGRERTGSGASDSNVPLFLYRGESGLYPETKSSLARLARDPAMSSRGFEQIMEVTEAARAFLVQQWRFAELEASGFLQHYGLPTDWLDLTDDVAVAASFAGSLRVGQLGAMAALPSDRLVAHGRLFNLSRRMIAERPRRQHAWVFSSDEHRNLKQPSTIEGLAIRWRLFRMTAADVERYGVDPELLDAHSDALAGILQLLIDSGNWDPDHRSWRPRLADDAARWLAGRLEPAPTIGKVVSDGNGITKIELQSVDQAATPYDREGGRRNNYESWSERHSPREVTETDRAAIESLITHDLSGVTSGHTLRITSADGLRALAAIDPE